MIKELGKGKARLIVSIGSGDARRKLTKTVTYKTKKELKQLYTDFEAECKQEPQADITVGEMLNTHIEHLEALGRKATSIHGYKVCEKRLDARFKAIKAKDCTTYHVEKEIARMSRKKLSAKTIKNTIGFVSAAFRHAIYTKQLTSNPCEYAILPTVKTKEKRILYREEIQPFLNAISTVDINEKVAYELALFMGLRRSEILGLKESDVDLVNKVISIHNTRHRVDGEDIDQDTKTARSTRVLALPDILVMDIAALLQTHAMFKYESTDYLIQNGFGEVLQPQALSQRLTRLEKRKNLPHVTLHGLRHTYASLLHASGIDMARISAELGHSNLSTTANIYTHIFTEATASSRGIAETINSEGFLPEAGQL